ncbi:MAG: hypothetical protein AB1414_18690 [bacterium]
MENSRNSSKNQLNEKILYFSATQIVKVFLLDFSPAKEILWSLYSQKPRGKKSRAPIAMLHSLILMTFLKIHSISAWVSQLKVFPLLAIISGFNPNDVPGVGTFYDFINRIYPESPTPLKNLLLPVKRKPTRKLKNNEKVPPKHPCIVNRLVTP